MHSFLYQAVSAALSLSNRFSRATQRQDAIVGATHRALFTVNLPCRATACYLLFVGGPMYQGSQSFICAGGYTQRARLSVVSCIVHGSYLSRAARRDASRRYEADFILPHTLSHYIITRCHPAERRSVDYRHSIDRRLHRQPSPPRSPRDRSSGRILWSSPPFIPSPLVRMRCLVSARDVSGCATRIRENASRFNGIDTPLGSSTYVRGCMNYIHVCLYASKFDVYPLLARIRRETVSHVRTKRISRNNEILIPHYGEGGRPRV